MARTNIPYVNVNRFGITQASPVVGDVVNGMEIMNNDGRIWVELANVSNAGSVNVTTDVPKLFDGDLTIADIIVALAPGSVKEMGPWKPGIFNRSVVAGATLESVYIDVSSSGITFRGYRLEP